MTEVTALPRDRPADQLKSPYKGLAPYEEEDSPFFFGREHDRKIISANLTVSRLTLLFGPSGVGKSSLLQAGVAAGLRDEARAAVAEGRAPPCVPIVFREWPGEPGARLAEAIRQGVRDTLGQSIDGAPPIGAGLADILDWWAGLNIAPLLIVLDQFEEYFLYHADEDGEGTLAVELPRAVNRRELPVHFLLSIREDALARLDRFKGRIPSLFANRLRIAHLNEAAAREAIVKPLERYDAVVGEERRVEWEPQLVEEVLRQVRAGYIVPGQTGQVGVGHANGGDARIEAPYLQLVMQRVWEREMSLGSRTLRLTTLNDDLGGADQIVSTHLDVAMVGLPEEEQEVAARVFRHLITPSGTKIAYTMADLAEYAGVPESDLRPVLKKLSDPDLRVLRTSSAPAGDENGTRYEIYHDALATPITVWRARYQQAEAERELEAALEAQERERKEAEAQRMKELKNKLTRWLAIALLLGLIGTGVATAFALRERNEALDKEETARSQARIAGSRALAANASSLVSGDPELSLLLAMEAVRLEPTDEAGEVLRQALLESRLLRVFSGYQDQLKNAAFSPDGKLFVILGPQTAEVRDLPSGRLRTRLSGYAGHDDSTLAAAFSPDGTRLAVVEGGIARVWDAASGDLLAELPSPAGRWVYAVAFNPSGESVMTASDDGRVRSWRVDGPCSQSRPACWRQLDVTGKPAVLVTSAAFSEDGALVLMSYLEGRPRIWETATGRLVAALPTGASGLRLATFSPDGRSVVLVGRDSKEARILELPAATSDRVAGKLALDKLSELRGHTDLITSAAFAGNRLITSSRDGTARIWELNTLRTIAVLHGHSDSVAAAVISPDGRWAVTASTDRTARLWRASDALELRGHVGAVNGASFSRKGTLVVTAGGDGTARVFDAATGASLYSLPGHSDALSGASFSPDGDLVVTASLDGTARLWDTRTHEQRGPPLPHGDGVVGAAFSPDGRRVFTASFDGIVREWDVETHRVLRTIALVNPDNPEDTVVVRNGVLSPDGTLGVLAYDRTAEVRDVLTLDVVYKLQHESTVTNANFSPDGTRLVTTSGDGTARIWDVGSRRQLATLVGHSRPVWSAAFSPDGRLIVTASSDETARIWDAATGKSLVTLRGFTDFVTTAEFSPDGTHVLTASDDGVARLHDCAVCGDLEEVLALARARIAETGRTLTPDERAKYLAE